jgi:hypothetical protein
MTWKNFRIHKRLNLDPSNIEEVYAKLSEFSRKNAIEALGFPARTIEQVEFKAFRAPWTREATR